MQKKKEKGEGKTHPASQVTPPPAHLSLQNPLPDAPQHRAGSRKYPDRGRESNQCKGRSLIMKTTIEHLRAGCVTFRVTQHSTARNKRFEHGREEFKIAGRTSSHRAAQFCKSQACGVKAFLFEGWAVSKSLSSV